MSENDYGRPFLDGIGDRKEKLFEALGKSLIEKWVAENPDEDFDENELGEKLTTDWQMARAENRGERVALDIVAEFGDDEDKALLTEWLKNNKF